VSKHWQNGDKCLVAIQLAQSGFGKLDEEGAYRLSLAAELAEAGVESRALAWELGLCPVQFDVSKYDKNQPRVPAAAPPAARDVGGMQALEVEGRSKGANAGGINQVYSLPKDTVVVARPDGSKIYDPDSATKRLMAPPRANF
jgi:hypothetical protein